MTTMKAVQFDQYGDADVLEVREVPRPSVEPDEVLVAVVACGINPGEAQIREGSMAERFPATFPSGQGSDFAGRAVEIGTDVVGFTVGDEVLGFTNGRAAQAQAVSVPASQVTLKPEAVPWDVAGALFVTGSTAYASVNVVGLKRGDTVAIAGATGGVGTIAVQLATRRGARVLGIAGPDNDGWLSAHGSVPVNYGAGLADRLKVAANGEPISAFLDFFGKGYVTMAVNELGVPPKRVNTTIDFDAAKSLNTKSVGSAEASSISVVADLANMIAAGELEIPIAQTFALDDVRQAYEALEKRHTLGKIVLCP